VSPTIVDVDKNKKGRKVIKPQKPKVAANKQLVSAPAVSSGSLPTTGPPTKLSFMDIISGVGKNLFNLR
jgi:hypothetical protein